MKIEWKDNAANVGKFELRVFRAPFGLKWCTAVRLCSRPFTDGWDFASDAAAREWCEQWIKCVIGSVVSDAAAQEREACAALVEQLAGYDCDAWNRYAEVLHDTAKAIRMRKDGST